MRDRRPHPERPHFITWDGTRLCYHEVGDPSSPRVVVLVNGLFCSDSYYRFLHEDLAAAGYRVVGFDLRGHGASEPPLDRAHATIQACARDVVALLDHLGVEKAAVGGLSLGVQISLETWRRYPERVRALMAFTGPYENPLGTFYGLKVPPVVWRASLGNLVRFAPRSTNLIWHQVFKLPIVHPVARLLRSTAASGELMQPFYDHQTVVHVPTGLRLALAAIEHSARDLLPNIAVPTLIVAGGRDTFTPPELSRTMRDEIPVVDFLEIPEGTHTTLLEVPEVVNPRVLAFLARVSWG
ncbi:MAG: alpha/beta hydrolase [Pseudomonadota bacterium]